MMAEPAGPGRFGTELWVRAASAVALVAVTVLCVVAGGWVFAALVAAASALILYEWVGMTGPYELRAAPKAAIVFSGATVLMAYRDATNSAVLTAVIAATLLAGQVADRRLRWLSAGMLYATLPGIAAVVLRGGPASAGSGIDLLAVAFVCAVVWTTDTAAYFSGRLIGGRKLAPRFSPKKTWSGAIGGAVFSVIAGLAVVVAGGIATSLPWVAAIALLLSVVSQAGDIAESAMKRHFGVKDSSNLIPGHGGIMDRVDGLVVALVVAVAIGLARGLDAGAGAGLLVW